ncbi:hypothetical protein EVAR_56821_1 [Eumeta japonica]|uniref:Uncharacterized protein n=1 Tax=Eumeta variegata TaxID=151549 RepID=A0A4C1Y414_EUMVA|nr:hypothetical protein EVAR_56821_1 [Eumeta japonica]
MTTKEGDENLEVGGRFTCRLRAAAVSLLLGRIGRCSGKEIARFALSLSRSAQAERDNESYFFVRAASVHRFIRRSYYLSVKLMESYISPPSACAHTKRSFARKMMERHCRRHKGDCLLPPDGRRPAARG